MAKKATPHDAQLIMKLYDLRREAEMRKARNFLVADFWPQSADDVVKLVDAFPSQENAWLRQVLGYWDMATTFVLQGALNEELFVQPGCSGEMFFIFAIILSILAPIGTMLIQLAISRRREALADASGVLLTRYPEGLISALQKIQVDNTPMRTAKDSTAHMWLDTPFKGKGTSWWHKIFMTHPPIEERIAALQAMGNISA